MIEVRTEQGAARRLHCRSGALGAPGALLASVDLPDISHA
jgi:hypothetical protein